MIKKNLRSIQQFKAEKDHGPLTRIVIEFIEAMENAVNRPKSPAVTAEAWEPLAKLVDKENFSRIGNYGEEVDWNEYLRLLVWWSNSSWWRGRVWRVWEVPGYAFFEAEERSSSTGPVNEAGEYHSLNSFCVYQFNEQKKITNLFIYDQRPLVEDQSKASEFLQQIK
jgi:hypothetical protein